MATRKFKGSVATKSHAKGNNMTEENIAVEQSEESANEIEASEVEEEIVTPELRVSDEMQEVFNAATDSKGRKVKASYVYATVSKLNRMWVGGGCANNELLNDIQKIGELYGKHKSCGGNAVVAAMAKAIRMVRATGNPRLVEELPALERIYNNIMSQLGNGVDALTLVAAVEKIAKKHRS